MWVQSVYSYFLASTGALPALSDVCTYLKTLVTTCKILMRLNSCAPAETVKYHKSW